MPQPTTPSEHIDALESADLSPDDLARLKVLVAQKRNRVGGALAAPSPAPAPAPQQAPALALLSADALRFGEAGEVFKDGGFFGPAASKMTYGLETPADQIPAITFPTAFLEKCKSRGGQLRLAPPNVTQDHALLSMEAMNALIAERWAREGKGRLLYDASGWKAREKFFTSGAPRPGWRVVFPNVVAGTTGQDDLAQTELLIAELAVLFQGMPMPKAYEDAIAEFERKKADTRILMEDDKRWPEASEAIEGFAFSRAARPIPVELLDIVAVNLDGTGKRPFRDVNSRTPVRSSAGYLVSVGHSRPVGARVDDGLPGCAYPPIGASLSLQSW